MSIIISEKDLDKIIIVGDRVLVKPKTLSVKTKSGLFLPPGIQQKDKLYSGYVVKVGPGYPLPDLPDYDESWKNKSDDVKYLPIQAKMGDLAVYLQNSTYEIIFKDEKYLIVPHSAILLLVRDEDLLKS